MRQPDTPLACETVERAVGLELNALADGCESARVVRESTPLVCETSKVGQYEYATYNTPYNTST
eukprot:8317786-Pyramimonas_sp.AAC.1